MINAGQYRKRITIYQVQMVKDAQGFETPQKTVILKPYAAVKTIRGFTLIVNNTNFEKAYTNFVIRYPKTQITRDMLVEFHGNTYTIEYINNVDENNVEMELQCKEVEK
jgi:SPP1 family predicted phage head-tail adaptor